MKPRGISVDLASSLFVLALVGVATAIVHVSSIAVAASLSVLLGLLLVGALEAVHQATHNSLFSSRAANRWVGTALAMVLLINFVRYRAFHANHHAHTATPNDPERVLYEGEGQGPWLAWLLAPVFYLGFALAIERSPYVAMRLRGQARLNRILLLLFAAALIGLTVWQPRTLGLLYWLPLACFGWFDYLLNQAEHYGMRELAPGEDPADVTNNLLLPAPLSWLFLHRNLHRVHHVQPRTPWHLTARAYRAQGAPGLRFGDFFSRFFAEGPRRWGVR